MDAEALYDFDIRGFTVARGLLASSPLLAATTALDPCLGRELVSTPAVTARVESLCGAGCRLDELGPVAAPEDPGGAVRLEGGAGCGDERSWRLRYESLLGLAQRGPAVAHPHGSDPRYPRPDQAAQLEAGRLALCHGLRVVIALSQVSQGSGAIVVCPCSHKSTLPAPDAVLSGEPAALAECAEEVSLQPGDVLFAAETLLAGVRGTPTALQAGFISSWTAASDLARPAPLPPPAWLDELSAEQREMVGPRLTGARPTAPEPAARTALQREAAGWSAREHLERWIFDLRGYLVVPRLMSREWLQEANAAVDEAKRDPSLLAEVPEAILASNDWRWPDQASERLRGTALLPRYRLHSLYTLPGCAAFRRMIAHPEVTSRLAFICGPGAREIAEPMCTVYPPGTPGGQLHSDADTGAGCNVEWALSEERPGFGPGSGGFVCIPGAVARFSVSPLRRCS